MNTSSTNVKRLVAQISSVIALTCAAAAIADAAAPDNQFCRQGDRGRLLGYEKVGSYPTPHDARAHFDEWIAFYQDFFNFPANLPVTFQYGFDSYKVTYCTNDAVLPGQTFGDTTTVTGMVSVPRTSGPLPTVAYVHGTSTSFYDAPSNPNTFGDFNPRGESFEGPPSTAVFAGNGFIYIAPDYLGLGDSTVPRHRYFHADTEASSAIDLLAAAQHVLADLKVRQNGKLFVFGFSQGGHSALALQRELERRRVKVDATAVVGGIFDVEPFFLRGLESETPFVPLYVTYLLLAFDDIYDVYESTADVFRQPYASIVEDRFDMRHFFDDIAAELPPPAQRYPDAVVPCRAHDEPRHADARPPAGERRGSVAAGGAGARLPQSGRRRGGIRRHARVGRTAATARRDDRRAHAPRIRSRQQLDSGDAASGAMVPGSRHEVRPGSRQCGSTRSSCGRWARASTPGPSAAAAIARRSVATIRSIRR